MTRNPNKTFWAKRRAVIAANKGAVTVQPATAGTVVAPVEIPAKEPTKAELMEQAKAAGIKVGANEKKAEIAAKIEAGR